MSSSSSDADALSKRQKVVTTRNRSTVYVFGQQTSGKTYIIHALNDRRIDARSCDEHSNVKIRLKPGDVVVYVVLHNGNSAPFFKIPNLLDLTDVEESETWSCHQFLVQPRINSDFGTAADHAKILLVRLFVGSLFSTLVREHLVWTTWTITRLLERKERFNALYDELWPPEKIPWGKGKLWTDKKDDLAFTINWPQYVHEYTFHLEKSPDGVLLKSKMEGRYEGVRERTGIVRHEMTPEFNYGMTQRDYDCIVRPLLNEPYETLLCITTTETEENMRKWNTFFD